MLSDIFPRHIIEFISFSKIGGDEIMPIAAAAETLAEQMGQLARNHEDVSVMFMDIVGE